SSGTTSIKYGTTRDKLLKLKTILSDGSFAEFSSLSVKEFQEKLTVGGAEGKIYNELYDLLSPPEVQKEIKDKFPHEDIHRRNTGYAVDELLKSEVFNPGGEKFNMCRLLSGSEGTLAFTTEITLQLDVLPPQKSAMVAAHFTTIEDCMLAVVPA